MARFFCIFHALSFELNFVFVQRFPLSVVIVPARVTCGDQLAINSEAML